MICSSNCQRLVIPQILLPWKKKVLVRADNQYLPILILGYMVRQGNEIIDVAKEEKVEHIKRVLHLDRDRKPEWHKVASSHTPESWFFLNPICLPFS